MKNLRYVMFAFTLTMTLLLAACGSPAPETVVVVVTATDAPPAEAPTAEPSPVVEAVALAGPKSGEAMKWIDGSTLLYIPAGDFTMGDGTNAFAHSVTLDGYWIQQTPVTNRMYEGCVRSGACSAPDQELGGAVYGNPQFASHPLVGVTWDQAQAYCTWIQGSLPTEAQWEKAARGADENPYPWGAGSPSCDLLNFANCNGSTTSVTSHVDGASPYGVLEMAGNVFEWISDWYDVNYYSQSPGINPAGPQSGQYRVVRGSSFETVAEQLASTIRRFNEQGDSGRDIGFRCAVQDPQPFAPYCQLTAEVPAGAAPVASCVQPEGVVTSQYCFQGDGYAVAQISFNTVWEERGTRLQCEEQIEGGLRTLVCRGPRGIESTNEVVVCNTACTGQADLDGLSPVCPSGYTLDRSTGVCTYTPILAQPGAGGCPLGYLARQAGGGQSCVAAPDAGGSCPLGLYFDELAGFCVPPNGETQTPFGIDNAALAAQTYAGCAAGYTYNDNFQCCQAGAGGAYPGCQPGYAFDAAVNACVPVATEELSGAGCIVVRLNTLKCTTIEDKVCGRIDSESLCVAELTCRWNEAADSCEPRP
jgi:formylglycine-generating enzyme required for sulfatase activity